MVPQTPGASGACLAYAHARGGRLALPQSATQPSDHHQPPATGGQMAKASPDLRTRSSRSLGAMYTPSTITK